MKKFALFGLGLGALILASKSICYVPQGHRMVLFNKLKGVMNQTYPQGFHLISPFLDVPILFKVTPSILESKFSLNTVDEEPIKIQLRTLNKPDVNNLPNLYKFFGLDYENLILNSILYESVKQLVSSKFTANDLLTDRQRFLDDLKEKVKEKDLQKYYIQVLEISLTNIEFSQDFQNQMESKHFRSND